MENIKNWDSFLNEGINEVDESNIGKYVKLKYNMGMGFYAGEGMIFEIKSIQKHKGRIHGRFVEDKVGYELEEVNDTDNKVNMAGDVDKIQFIDISKDEAMKINKSIHSKKEMMVNR